jgi:3-deoxy-manno-octulosonate cytidylyltransferase (CMP-KDO synthetase)
MMTSQSKKALVLIPSRYGSQRLPAKPLTMINGKTMIQRVALNMQSTLFDAVVVTDHPLIKKSVEEVGCKAVLLEDEVLTGTERVGRAYTRFFSDVDYDFVINVQGDEPLLKAAEVEDLIKYHETHNVDVATLYYPRNDREDYHNPNCVKIALDLPSGRCHYFSRSPIPFYRNKNAADKIQWYQHIGVYSYRPAILKQFIKLQPSWLELAESLEQLRALQQGWSIGAVAAHHLPQSVDISQDVVRVTELLTERKED